MIKTMGLPGGILAEDSSLSIYLSVSRSLSHSVTCLPVLNRAIIEFLLHRKCLVRFQFTDTVVPRSLAHPYLVTHYD